MATRKDYTAEAQSIHKHLTPAVPFIVLAEYIAERATYYEQDNPARFNRDLFFKVCIRGTDTPVRSIVRSY